MEAFKHVLPTASDIVGARAYLRWSQDDLAKRAGIGRKTLFNIENMQTTPSNKILEKINNVFLSEGIMFLQEGGFKANQSLFRVLEGAAGIREFFDDIVATASQDDCHEILASGFKEKEFDDKLIEVGILDSYVEKMRQTNCKLKILTSVEFAPKPFEENYIESKVLPQNLFIAFPIYIYKNKVGMMMLHTNKIFVISDELLASAYKEQFYNLWNNPEAKNHHL